VLPVVIGVLGAVSVLLIVGLDALRSRSLALDRELARGIDRVRVETIEAHLRLEELVAGFGDDAASARQGFRRARDLAAALVPGAAAETPELGAAAVRMSDEIGRLADLADERLAAQARRPGAREAIDDVAFDRQADRVLAAADHLDGAVAVHSDSHQRRSERLRRVALAGWTALVLGAAWVLARYERHRAAAERALRESERRLFEAQKLEAVGRLAGGIAHDVNNVLATVRANCELVLRKEMPRERLARSMETVIEAVLRASSLVERLLTFARRQPTRPELVDLGDVVEGFERLALGSLSGQRLEIARSPGLWPVEIDLAQAEQALANLFFNARDATATGGAIRVAVRNEPGVATGATRSAWRSPTRVSACRPK
jgi:signal transduction histidine kinase